MRLMITNMKKDRTIEKENNQTGAFFAAQEYLESINIIFELTAIFGTMEGEYSQGSSNNTTYGISVSSVLFSD